MTFPLFRTLARRTRLLRNPFNQISGATWTSTSTTRASITTAKMVTTAEILKKAARPLEFPNKDQKFWWDATAHSLAELLARSGYTEEEQAAHLAWYRRFIPHTLGPRPVVGKPYTFVPGPVFDGSPVEHSINWKEKSKSKRLVRFTVGPASFEQADDQDPFSQDEVRRFLECQMDAVPGLSLERFNTVCENLFIKPENYASLIARIPDYTPRVQAWVAFDLVPTPMAKVYFVPMLKWLETGKTLNEIAFETTIACNTEKNGSFDGPVAFTKKYFDTFPVETRPRVEFMAIDCVDAPSSRVKHYVRTKANTFNKVVDLYTLGGSLKSEDIDAGIAALKELWPLIFRLDVSPEELGDAEVWPTGGPGAGAAIEMRPGQDEPEVKIHWPVRLINGTDEQLADSLATYFRQRGHGEFADNYKSDLKASFPGHDIENKNGTHTFVSFSWSKKTGVYMTMYYSTKIFDVEIPNWDREAQPVEDIWIHYGKLVNDPSYKRVPQ